MRKGRRRYLAACAVLVLAGALTGCASGAAEAGPDLAGKVFVSTEVSGHELVAGSRVKLMFGQDSISAHAGCNTLTGAATWESGTLAVDDALARTMMACSGELMDQDDWLEQLLLAGPALSLEGETPRVGDDPAITLEQE